MTEQQRASFEAWYRHHHGDRDVYVLDESGEYAEKQVQGAFNAWQAAIKADRQARGEPIGEVLAFPMGDKPKTHSTLAGLKDPQPVGMLVYAAPLPHQIPEGYKLVPVEPTVEMLFACQDAGSISNHQRGKRIYKAMLEAAPEVKG